MHSGGALPRWPVNAAVTDQSFNTLANLWRELERSSDLLPISALIHLPGRPHPGNSLRDSGDLPPFHTAPSLR